MHLQTLRVHELKRFEAISASYPDKNWCLGTLKEMFKLHVELNMFSKV